MELRCTHTVVKTTFSRQDNDEQFKEGMLLSKGKTSSCKFVFKNLHDSQGNRGVVDLGEREVWGEAEEWRDGKQHSGCIV